MVTGFTKSKEGEAQYSKIGVPGGYQNNVEDVEYENWLENTSAENLKDYSKHSEKEVTQISRHMVGNQEFLSYSFVHYRLDRARLIGGGPILAFILSQKLGSAWFKVTSVRRPVNLRRSLQ
jgi:hypothetical protein